MKIRRVNMDPIQMQLQIFGGQRIRQHIAKAQALTSKISEILFWGLK
jgi:hypothetical protein